MKGTIFPYPTLANRLGLAVEGVTYRRSVEDQGRKLQKHEYMPDDERYTIAIVDTERYPLDSSVLDLNLQIQAPRGELQTMEKQGMEPRVVVVLSCGQTQMRLAHRARASEADHSIWTVDLELDRQLFAGTVNLRAILYGTVDELDHRYLGESSAWEIVLDPGSRPPVSGALPVRWVDFTASTDVELHGIKEEPFYLNMSTGALPEVLLNSSFQGLPELFPDTGRPPGQWGSLHELQRLSIARSVWMAMFQVSLAAVESPEGEEPDWPGVEWQRRVLREILPLVYENQEEPEGALRETVGDFSTAASRSELESRALRVIGHRIINEGKGLRWALRQAERAET